MKTKEFISFLLENQIWKSVLPSLNIWLFYVIICIIAWSTLGVFTAGITFVSGIIFVGTLKKKVKESFCDWWRDLPQLKFHLIWFVIEAGILFLVVKLTGPLILSKNSANTQNGNGE